MRRLSILGSTGSIGTNTIEVIDANPDSFDIKYLTAGSNAENLAQQTRKYHPEAIAIADSQKADLLSGKLSNIDVEILSGREGLLEIACRSDVDLVINSIVGPPGM